MSTYRSSVYVHGGPCGLIIGDVPIRQREALEFGSNSPKRVFKFIEPITVPKEVLSRFVDMVIDIGIIVRFQKYHQCSRSTQCLKALDVQQLLLLTQRVPGLTHTFRLRACSQAQRQHKICSVLSFPMSCAQHKRARHLADTVHSHSNHQSLWHRICKTECNVRNDGGSLYTECMSSIHSEHSIAIEYGHKIQYEKRHCYGQREYET